MLSWYVYIDVVFIKLFDDTSQEFLEDYLKKLGEDDEKLFNVLIFGWLTYKSYPNLDFWIKKFGFLVLFF